MSVTIAELARAYARWYETDYIDHLVDEELMNRSDAEREWSKPLTLTPVSDDAIAAVERETGPLPADYVAFMRELGAGHILAAQEESEPDVFDVPAPAAALEDARSHAAMLADIEANPDDDESLAYCAYASAQLPRYADEWLVLTTNESFTALLAYRGDHVGHVSLLLREAWQPGDVASGKRVTFEAFWRAFFAAARRMSPLGSDDDLP